MSDNSDIHPTHVGQYRIYSLAGETDKALETLEMSIEAGIADPTWMELDSDLDHVRDHPRFRALLERIKASP